MRLDFACPAALEWKDISDDALQGLHCPRLQGLLMNREALPWAVRARARLPLHAPVHPRFPEPIP